ncbi:MAG: response regulator transcription factor [Candidatus Accumulibacter sp.]|uniref:Response regulator transcription factor n=1 Tax=Candidatus Accumulibacter proximus TaxID=2954385 RepID=A0A935UHU2_9PROT|nr:response regulator transcription factor [Candidatus Accumulibacter proximus]
MRLLLAEDDPMIGSAVEQGLREAGFAVDWVRDGEAAELALRSGTYALLVLDLGLARQDGLALLRKMRVAGNDLPVLIVTARSAVSDRVTGLNLGADDYLAKPFDLEELVARIHALLRRHAGRARPELRLGTLVLDPLAREVRLHGVAVTLANREFALLEALFENPGAVLTTEQLEDRLYGWGEEIASNAIEVHVHKLRKKLGAGWIRNVRGVGYRLVEAK